jgi:hypothetical protein
VIKKNIDDRKKRKDIDIKKVDIDIGKEILKLLSITPFMKMITVINDIRGRANVSRITVVRRIKRLAYEKELARIHADEFSRYGIQEDDKRQVYLASKETLKLKEHVEEIFKLFESKKLDPNEVKIGARELRYYEQVYFRQYFLDANHLNILADILEKSITNNELNDDELRSILVGVLLNEICTNGIKPSNQEAFVETLGTLLDQHPTSEFYNKPNNPIGNIIYILGVLRSPKVIERLKQDAATCPANILQNISSYYTNKFTAKIIEDSGLELMKYEAKLQKDRKVEALDFIENVRRQAAYDLRELKTTGQKLLYE